MTEKGQFSNVSGQALDLRQAVHAVMQYELHEDQANQRARRDDLTTTVHVPATHLRPDDARTELSSQVAALADKPVQLEATVRAFNDLYSSVTSDDKYKENAHANILNDQCGNVVGIEFHGGYPNTHSEGRVLVDLTVKSDGSKAAVPACPGDHT